MFPWFARSFESFQYLIIIFKIYIYFTCLLYTSASCTTETNGIISSVVPGNGCGLDLTSIPFWSFMAIFEYTRSIGLELSLCSPISSSSETVIMIRHNMKYNRKTELTVIKCETDFWIFIKSLKTSEDSLNLLYEGKEIHHISLRFLYWMAPLLSFFLSYFSR